MQWFELVSSSENLCFLYQFALPEAFAMQLAQIVTFCVRKEADSVSADWVFL